MKFSYSQLIWFILIEIGVVIFVVLVIYLAKLFSNLKERRNRKVLTNVKLLLSSAIATNDITDARLQLDKKSTKPAVLLQAIYETLDENKHENAGNIIEQFVKLNLHKTAKKYSRKRNWKKRLRAAQIYSHYWDESDKKNILKLINDAVPLTLLHITTAALRNPSQEIAYALVKRTANERRLSLSLFLNVIKKSHPGVDEILIDIIKKEEDPYRKVACYKMLMQLDEKGAFDTSDDITSENIELKLAALNYMAQTETPSIAVFVDHLDDTDWRVRVVCIQLLAKLDGQNQINNFTRKLSDPEWWVRANAANALLGLGEAGVQALSSIDSNSDRFAYEAAQRVLNRQETA